MRLIEYLEHARKLENDIYLCDVTINNLENRIRNNEFERKCKLEKINQLPRPSKGEVSVEVPTKPERKYFSGWDIPGFIVIWFLLWFLGIYAWGMIYGAIRLVMGVTDDIVTEELISTQNLSISILCVVAFITTLFVYRDKYGNKHYSKQLEAYENKLKYYQSQCDKVNDKYDTEWNEYRRKCETMEQEINNSYNSSIASLKQMIQEIQTTKSDIKLALSHVYAYNIVYPKYRELVPITMFCEYLASGRCSMLEGHEGAYNIYENELRQNIIISKLDTISRSLESIRSNQYLLYTAISEANTLSSQMFNSAYVYFNQQARANALQELSNKAILDSNRALQDLGQKTLDEIKKFNT
ncbi:MAG: hypothetical protein IJV70_05050 [Clostridia bacterium]|nr:hypothetical protein [Clostridia bacterium]